MKPIKMLTPNGETYFKVSLNNKLVQFEEFSRHKVTVNFDARVLEQLIPALQKCYEKYNK